MHAIEHLHGSTWTKPAHYAGFSPDGDYIVLTRTRDSDLLAECNWDVACETLNAQAYDGGTDEFETRPPVYHWRAGHFLCGWVEYLMVRSDAPDTVQTEAGEILCSLADYPILSEDKFGEREWNAVCDYWENCSVRDRVDYLQRAEMCIFAARRAEMPEDDSGTLFDRLRNGL